MAEYATHKDFAAGISGTMSIAEMREKIVWLEEQVNRLIEREDHKHER